MNNLDRKRLNIVLPIELYDKMENKVKDSDIKNITSLIKISLDKYLKVYDVVKDNYINSKDIPDILRVLGVLYNVKNFKNSMVKYELKELYGLLENYSNLSKVNEFNESIESKEAKIKINSLDISYEELIMLELSCKDIDILLTNKIIKESVYYVKYNKYNKDN